MPENLLSNRNDVEKRKRLAMCSQVLARYFNDWRVIWPTHEVTKKQLAIYLQLLDGLSLRELEMGCREVGKTALTFPKPAEIIAASRMGLDEPLSGPTLLDYPEISDEERKSGAEITAEFKKRMGWDNQPKPEAPRKLQVMHPSKSWEEQKAELARRGYLTTEPHDPKCLCPQCRERRAARP